MNTYVKTDEDVMRELRCQVSILTKELENEKSCHRSTTDFWEKCLEQRDSLQREVETDRDCIESLRTRLVNAHAALQKAKELLIETKACCIAPSRNWEDRRDETLDAIKGCGL